eukprot:15267303-Alexandrium_andersonii.AAC.1
MCNYKSATSGTDWLPSSPSHQICTPRSRLSTGRLPEVRRRASRASWAGQATPRRSHAWVLCLVQ